MIEIPTRFAKRGNVMRKVLFILLVFFLVLGNAYAQNDPKKEDKKEKKEEKKPDKKEAKRQSFGELAEESGKRIWNNVKGFFNVVAEDVIEKTDKFKKIEKPKKEKPKEKEKSKKDKDLKKPSKKDEPNQ